MFCWKAKGKIWPYKYVRPGFFHLTPVTWGPEKMHTHVLFGLVSRLIHKEGSLRGQLSNSSDSPTKPRSEDVHMKGYREEEIQEPPQVINGYCFNFYIFSEHPRPGNKGWKIFKCIVLIVQQ